MSGFRNKVVEDTSKLSATKHLVFSDVSLTMIQGTPPSGGGWLNERGVAKYSDFERIKGYISETVQDTR